MAEVQLSGVSDLGDNGDDSDVTLKNISAAISRLQESRRDNVEHDRACLLKMESDPAVRGPINGHNKTSQKKRRISEKTNSEPALPNTKKANAANQATELATIGTETMNAFYSKNDALNGNLFTAWLNFCTEFANCTAQAQLQFMRTLSAPTAVAHPNEIQRRAFELWLHAVPPKVPNFLLDEA